MEWAESVCVRGGETQATGDACKKCRDAWAVGFSYMEWNELVDLIKKDGSKKELFDRAVSYVQKNDCARQTEWMEADVKRQEVSGHVCFRIMKAWTRAEFQNQFGCTPEQLQVKTTEMVSETGSQFKGVCTVDPERPDRYSVIGPGLRQSLRVLLNHVGYRESNSCYSLAGLGGKWAVKPNMAQLLA